MYTDFAWECLKRNRVYINEWNLIQQRKHDVNSEADAGKWGLLRYVDPGAVNAKDVFWHPEISSRTIDILLSQHGDHSWESITAVPGVMQREIMLKDGTQCMKIYDKHSYFQLLVANPEMLADAVPACFYLSLNLPTDVRQVVSLCDFLTGKPSTLRLCKKDIELLKIIDGMNKGLSHREIAEEIFGAVSVERNWASDSWLRARTRYRIKKAENLINRGYLKYV